MTELAAVVIGGVFLAALIVVVSDLVLRRYGR